MLFFIVSFIVAFGTPLLILLMLYRFWIPNRVVALEQSRTPRAPDRVAFLFTSDTGSGNQAQRETAELLDTLASRFAPDAVIMAGDNFPMHGVKDLQDSQWKSKFLEMYHLPNLHALPFFTVLGNHDYRGNRNAQIEYTLLSAGHWNLPARHYLVSWKPLVDLIGIDTNVPDRLGWLGLRRFPLDRLERRAQQLTAPWRICVGHRPLISCGKYQKITWNVKQLLGRFLAQSGAQVYISGHDHNMQHLVCNNFGRTLHQIVCGCGGSSLNDVSPEGTSARFAAKKHGAVLGEFTRERAIFRYFAADSQSELYSFELLIPYEP